LVRTEIPANGMDDAASGRSVNSEWLKCFVESTFIRQMPRRLTGES